MTASDYQDFDLVDAALEVAVPLPTDDKYSRGVLGMVTGSVDYPGAAVLGVEAALRTGVGMVRYRGTAVEPVLHRRPEAVTKPGRVQAWVLGSGIDAANRDRSTDEVLHQALSEAVPVVLDSGALTLLEGAAGPAVITPHYGELATLLSVESDRIAADAGRWCATAHNELGVTVLLKGSRTHIAGPGGVRWVTSSSTPWLASAGTGDVLAGILGALVATRSHDILHDPALLSRLAATAAVIHAETAQRLSCGGPLVALDLAEAVSATIARILRR